MSEVKLSPEEKEQLNIAGYESSRDDNSMIPFYETVEQILKARAVPVNDVALEFEAMKVANEKRRRQAFALAYPEEAFMALLENKPVPTCDHEPLDVDKVVELIKSAIYSYDEKTDCDNWVRIIAKDYAEKICAVFRAPELSVERIERIIKGFMILGTVMDKDHYDFKPEYIKLIAEAIVKEAGK